MHVQSSVFTGSVSSVPSPPPVYLQSPSSLCLPPVSVSLQSVAALFGPAAETRAGHGSSLTL